MGAFKDKWTAAKQVFETAMGKPRPKLTKHINIPLFGKVKVSSASGFSPLLDKLEDAIKAGSIADAKKYLAQVEALHLKYFAVLDKDLQEFFDKKKAMKDHYEKLQDAKAEALEKGKPKDPSALKAQQDAVKAIRKEMAEVNAELDMFEQEMKTKIKPAFMGMKLLISNIELQASKWITEHTAKPVAPPKVVVTNKVEELGPKKKK